MEHTHQQKIPFYTLSLEETYKTLKTSPEGLSVKEAEERLQKEGHNKLPEAKPESFGTIFLRQFQSPLIYVLAGAALVVFLLGETIDALVILFVLFFNALVGSIQEGKAQNTLLALKQYIATNATVLRQGEEDIIPDFELVRGDIMLLRAGEKVPADGRVIHAVGLRVDEASLTGESNPVTKEVEKLKDPELPLGDQRNMVFKGTHIVAGSGRAVVVNTGLSTMIGSISKEIRAIDTEIPLKGDIRYLSRLIIMTVGTIGASLFLLGVGLGKGFREMFTTVVSLSVSIIPEGLPIVMTLVLAQGVWRMTKRNALVKKLQAVEALGQTRIIAVDKTGTLTRNEIVIQKVYVEGKMFEVGGIGYEPKGVLTHEGKEVSLPHHPELLLAGRIAALCGNAYISFSPETNLWNISGDPTEAALVTFGAKTGFLQKELEKETSLIGEIAFDYKTKYHATLHKELKDGTLLSVVGAPEAILDLCDAIWHKEKALPLSQKKRGELDEVIRQMSEEGLRVIAFATAKGVEKMPTADAMPKLTFGGLYGMRDALRPEVKDAMAKAKLAGMRVVMITGDHEVTAKAIAKEAGIYKEGDMILSGKDLQKLSSRELAQKLPYVSVFARVTPEHKLVIIQAYRERGEVVAMTGDGVNDAPSLVAADLGVAMGRIGTEVAKEAADIVLLDDNFGSIMAAVEEGRNIYKTIQKVILYLFSTSMGELFTITGAILLGFPLPLLAAQIIWLNLVTDGFLDVALAMEPKEKHLLEEKFSKPKHALLDMLMIQRMLIMALPMTIGTLFLFSRYFEGDLTKAWSISLTTLAVFQWFNAWNCRSRDKSVFQMNPFSNPFLVGATIIVVLLQLAALYTQPLQSILRTTPLSLSEWGLIILVAFSIIVVEEIRKFFYRQTRA